MAFTKTAPAGAKITQLSELRALLAVECQAIKQLEDRGINISFAGPGWTYRPGECIGERHSRRPIEMTISIKETGAIWPVVAFTRRESQTTAVKFVDFTKVNGRRIYRWSIPLKELENGSIPTWPDNRLTILCRDDDNNYQLYLVGTFAQDFQIWGWATLADQGKITQIEGKAIIAGRSTMWQALISAMDSQCVFKTGTLIPCPEPESDTPPTDLPENQGVVQYFNLFQGFGYAWFNDPAKGVVSARCHYSKIQSRSALQLRSLEAGDKIQGRLVVRDGLQIENILVI